MSELGTFIKQVESLRTSYDLEEVEARVKEIGRRTAEQRSCEVEKALTLIACSGFLVPENTPKLMIQLETCERLRKDGFMVTEAICGDIHFEITVPGDSFIRRTLLVAGPGEPGHLGRGEGDR